MKQDDLNLSKVISKGVADAIRNTTVSVNVKSEAVATLGVVECAQVLKRYCNSNNCDNCSFNNRYDCMLKSTYPENWDV